MVIVNIKIIIAIETLINNNIIIINKTFIAIDIIKFLLKSL